MPTLKENVMKKFLIALNLVIWSFVGYQVAYAAEPTKTEKKVEKKEVKPKAPPSDKKPTPKKKPEAK